jgi:hypothetical protein
MMYFVATVKLYLRTLLMRGAFKFFTDGKDFKKIMSGGH